MDFLAISGCDTSLYHSQGGATTRYAMADVYVYMAVNKMSNLVDFKHLQIVYTCKSSYCFQCVLAITILSVCPSVTRVDRSKTVQFGKLFHREQNMHPARHY